MQSTTPDGSAKAEVDSVSPELLRAVLSAISDAVLITDSQGRLTFVCPGLKHIFGVEAASVPLGSDIRELLGNFELDAAILEAQGEIRHIESTITTPGGRRVRLIINVRQVCIGDGTRLFSCRDATDLILRSESEQRLLGILESAQDFIGIVDAEHRPVYINQGGRRMLGLDPAADLTQWGLHDFHPAWAADIVQKEGIPSAMTRGSWTGQTALLSLSGAEIPVSQQIIAHRDAQAELTHLSTVCRDLSSLFAMGEVQRLRAEQQASVSELGLAAARGDSMEDLLPRLLEEGCRLLQTDLLAVSGAVLTGQACRLIAIDKAGLVWRGDAAEGLIQEARFLGSLLVSVPLPGEHASAIMAYSERVQSFSSEDAEYVQALANVLSAAWIRAEDERLEQERYALQTQLAQAQKLEALGTLAGGIAHDFNNILYAIIGYSELVLSELPPEGQLRHYQQEVLKAAGRAAELVRQILSISRQSTDDLEAVRVGELVQEVAALIRAGLPSSIELCMEIDAPEACVIGVRTHLVQVVMNLATNGGHAMRDVGGKLTIGVALAEIDEAAASRSIRLHPGTYVRLTVRDSGGGIARENLGRVFEPFFTTKQVGEGTGLGLSIVHGIVTRYGGSIEIDSRPGRGTLVEVLLPHAQERVPEAEPAKEQVDFDGGGARILFVDDEPQIAELGKLLAGFNLTVDSFDNPLEALATFRRDPQSCDILITDMTMPGMSGLELAAACKELRPDIKVLLCSGLSFALGPEDAASYGIKQLLQKPFSRRTLVECVRRCIQEP